MNTTIENLVPPIPSAIGLVVETETRKYEASRARVESLKDRLGAVVEDACRVDVGALRSRLTPEGLAIVGRLRALAHELRERFDRIASPELRDGLRQLAASPAAWEIEPLVAKLTEANARHAGTATHTETLARQFEAALTAAGRAYIWSEAFVSHLVSDRPSGMHSPDAPWQR